MEGCGFRGIKEKKKTWDGIKHIVFLWPPKTCQNRVNQSKGLTFLGSALWTEWKMRPLCVCVRETVLTHKMGEQKKKHSHRLVNNSQAYQAEVVRPCFDNTTPNHRGKRMSEVSEEWRDRHNTSTLYCFTESKPDSFHEHIYFIPSWFMFIF